MSMNMNHMSRNLPILGGDNFDYRKSRIKAIMRSTGEEILGLVYYWIHSTHENCRRQASSKNSIAVIRRRKSLTSRQITVHLIFYFLLLI